MAHNASGRTFVLVHGAWHGGWCWRRVADILEAQGHKVFTPTLTGLAERSHLLNCGITLDTHITDIVNLFRWEEIQDAILCAHSYGGWPVSGAMEVLRSRVSALIFIDAHLPDDGQSGVETSNGREEILAAHRRGEISRAPKSASYLCVNENDQTWVDGKLTPQPIGTSLQPIRLTGAREEVARKVYVRATGFPSEPFDQAFAKAKARGWHPYEVPAGHDLMIDAPELLGEIVLGVAMNTKWLDAAATSGS
jgi:pimeloyl-ACP methyl ester carboxylesterase